MFVVDDTAGAPRKPGGGPTIIVDWAAADTLIVKYDQRARMFRREERVGGAHVIYVPFLPDTIH